MRFFITFAVLAAGLVFSPAVHADDNELFSEVAMEFVYATGDQSKSDRVDSPKADVLPTRITGSSTLITLLKSAGYEPTKVDSRRVSLEIRHSGWNLKANLQSDVEADRLTIEIPLAKISDEATVDQAKLLRLLTVGNDEGDIFFSYDKSDGMIELRRVMPNRGLTSQRIQQELEQMAGVAQTHEDDWSKLERTAKTTETTAATEKTPALPAKTPAAKPTQKTVAAAPKLSLVGTWSAALGSGQAFAIQINKDATFQLVHIKSGKSVSSTGKAARSGNQLTLNGSDGTKIVGTVAQKTPDAFQLSISSSTLNFKKAK